MASAEQRQYRDVIDEVTFFLRECFDLDRELPKGLEAVVLVRYRRTKRKIAMTKIQGTRRRTKRSKHAS